MSDIYQLINDSTRSPSTKSNSLSILARVCKTCYFSRLLRAKESIHIRMEKARLPFPLRGKEKRVWLPREVLWQTASSSSAGSAENQANYYIVK